MKILNLLFSFQSGGIENLLVDTLNCWENQEDKLFLCIINDDLNERLVERINQDRIHVIRLQRSKGSRKLIRYVRKLVKEMSGNMSDVIHCHNLMAVKFALLYKIFGGKGKIIYTVHDTKIATAFTKVDKVLICFFVDHIVAISRAVFSEIKQSIHSSNNISIVYNGVDFSRFRDIAPINKPIRNFGMIARIIPEKKGHIVLLKAVEEVWKKYPETHLYFAGGYPNDNGESKRKIDLALKEVTRREQVHFLGNINDIPNFMSTIDALVLPSYYEGFGIVLIEAMASRRPVIASDLEGPSEIIGNNAYGYLFPKGDYRALADAMIRMIEQDEYNLDKNYLYAEEAYSIVKVCQRLRNIYLHYRIGE